MKSYFLGPLVSREAAITALSGFLPGENDTWLFKDTAGDVIAYFYLTDPDCMTPDWTLVADLSGRHYNKDSEVIAILQRLKTELGGEVTNDA
jgi:hypothetical protein